MFETNWPMLLDFIKYFTLDIEHNFKDPCIQLRKPLNKHF